jgi:hypothetical protein
MKKEEISIDVSWRLMQACLAEGEGGVTGQKKRRSLRSLFFSLVILGEMSIKCIFSSFGYLL